MNEKVWRILCIAIGVGGLLFSRHYSGVGASFLQAYGANVSVSFAAYFLLRILNLPPRGSKYAAALYAFLAVSAQEVAQALRLYPGMFDALDFLFDAAGVGLALVIDMAKSKKIQSLKRWVPYAIHPPLDLTVLESDNLRKGG